MTLSTCSLNIPCAAEITSKIEEFINGIPGQVQSSLEVLQSEVNNTIGFVKYIDSNLQSIAGNVTANLQQQLLYLQNITTPGAQRYAAH